MDLKAQSGQVALYGVFEETVAVANAVASTGVVEIRVA
jgi:hypothetical protein